MKIAVDAMGGDHAPEVVIAGVEKARDHDANLEFLLYGDEAKIKPLIHNQDRLTIIHTAEKINSDDEPVRAIRRKKQASMVLANAADSRWKRLCHARCWRQCRKPSVSSIAICHYG